MRVLILGAGMGGLSAGVLLARDGHQVTVLERDPAPPPAGAAGAWDTWERRGVNQFRLAHFFQPRFRQLAAAELADLLDALDDAGALRLNPIAVLPERVTGGWHAGDERFEACTGRRPVVEAALAQVAERTEGVTVRRGTVARGLRLTEDRAVPHVDGLLTADGELIRADLVVDAMGRRSPMSEWLRTAGVEPPVDEVDDLGYVYYCRHFRSADGRMPEMRASLNQPYGSVSIITLPADNGTWSTTIVGSTRDTLLRRAKDADTWQAVVRSFPLAAHWADGQPLGGVDVMARIEDRRRRLCGGDALPVVSGLALLGDSWSCTNPSIGRGASLALMHAVELRDLLRHDVPCDDVELAMRWEQRSAATVEPYVHDTRAFDRHRLAEIHAHLAGERYTTEDPAWNLGRALATGSARDPELFRAMLEIPGMLRRGVEVFRQPGLAARALRLADPTPPPGPDRAGLEAILHGAVVAA